MSDEWDGEQTLYDLVVTGRCTSAKCDGVASSDYILLNGSCPDCQLPICNVTAFADLADASHLRAALDQIRLALERMTNGTVPPKRWRAELLQLRAVIEAAMAENETDPSVDMDLEFVSDAGERETSALL